MELFYWTLAFDLFLVLLGAGLMAALLNCTVDHQFRLVVRIRKRGGAVDGSPQ